MVIEDKLSTTRFHVDSVPHIRVDRSICDTCREKTCLYVCPVQNYKLNEGGKLEFSWQGCMECGACRIGCAYGAIEWHFPRGGFGVCFRYG